MDVICEILPPPPSLPARSSSSSPFLVRRWQPKHPWTKAAVTGFGWMGTETGVIATASHTVSGRVKTAHNVRIPLPIHAKTPA